MNWNSSFDSKDKIPFGTYICYNEMEELFPDSDIERINSNLFDYLEDRNYRNEEILTYFNHHIQFDSLQREKLLHFSNRNNIIFLSFLTSNILSDSLETSYNNGLGTNLKEMALSDSISTLTLEDEEIGTEVFKIKGSVARNYFTTIPESAIVLGYLKDQGKYRPNFIKVPSGQGWYYLHAEPYLFTNISLLKKPVASYVEDVFSYLPTHTSLCNNYRIISRRYQERSDGGSFAFLNFAMKHQPLKYGLLLMLLGGILYILFNSSRRQNAIPYTPPYQNDELTYSKSLSRTYKGSNNFKYLCSQKMGYFRNMMYEHYYFTQIIFDDKFAQQLIAKSQVSPTECYELVNYLNQINQAGYCNKDQFLKLSALLDDFYLKSKLYGSH